MLNVIWLTAPFFDLRRDNYGKSGKFTSPVWRKKRKSLSNCREIFDEPAIYQIELNCPICFVEVTVLQFWSPFGPAVPADTRHMKLFLIDYCCLHHLINLGAVGKLFGRSLLNCVDYFYLINKYLGGCERSPPRNFLTSLN